MKGLFQAVLIIVSLQDTALGFQTPKVSNTKQRRELITEIGKALFENFESPCDISIAQNFSDCHKSGNGSSIVLDYPTTDSEVQLPNNGEPWGVHLTPSKTSGSYIISWQMSIPTVGPPPQVLPDTSSKRGFVQIGYSQGKYDLELVSTVVVYMRKYVQHEQHSYLSSFIHHVEVRGLKPSKMYYYRVGDSSHISAEFAFKSLPEVGSANTYPLRIGLVGDVGQTRVSTETLHHLQASEPDVVFHTGDLTYADRYGPLSADVINSTEGGTHQARWDTYAVLSEFVSARVPFLYTVGNHEVEEEDIPALRLHNTTTFTFPDNFPFQSFAARYPKPGQDNFGDIDTNLYYSVDVGPVHLVVLNNYIPFHTGSAQHDWFLADLGGVSREVTPWVLVSVHAAPYHTYSHHYKEMECWLEHYEDHLYSMAVDLVISGHVHAYERTHPLFRYEMDTCAPAYITIGDGGNSEGIYRSFIDERDPEDPANRTFCEIISQSQGAQGTVDVNSMLADQWGPDYQRTVHPPGCPTISFQPPYSTSTDSNLPLGLVPNTSNPDTFWCQSSQPKWSAHRNPSFGYAMLIIESPSVAKLEWYQNVDGVATLSDSTTYERLESCANIKRLTVDNGKNSILLDGNNYTSLPYVLVALGLLTFVLSLCILSVTCIYHKTKCRRDNQALVFGRLDDSNESSVDEPAL